MKVLLLAVICFAAGSAHAWYWAKRLWAPEQGALQALIRERNFFQASLLKARLELDVAERRRGRELRGLRS